MKFGSRERLVLLLDLLLVVLLLMCCAAHAAHRWMWNVIGDRLVKKRVTKSAIILKKREKTASPNQRYFSETRNIKSQRV